MALDEICRSFFPMEEQTFYTDGRNTLNSGQEERKISGLSPPDSLPKLKKPLRGKRFRSIEEVSNEVTWVIRRINNKGVQTGIQDLPKRWTAVIKHNGDYTESL
jgi:hypothetical protein